MIKDLFEKYLNVNNYLEHQLYKDAKEFAIAAATRKTIGDDKYQTYQGFIEGFIEGYIGEILKGLVILIKLELHEGTLNLTYIEDTYHISRNETLYLLKQVLNDNIKLD